MCLFTRLQSETYSEGGRLQGLSSPIDQWNLWISWCFEALKGAVPPPGKIPEYAPVYSLFDGFFFNLKLGHDSDIDLTLNIFSRLEYSVSCFKFLFIIYNSEHTLILSFHILQFWTPSYSVFSYFTILNTILSCLFIFYNSEHHLILSFHNLQFWTPSCSVFSYFTILNTISSCLFIFYKSGHHLILSFHIFQFWTLSYSVYS